MPDTRHPHPRRTHAFYGDADLRYDLRGFDATDNHEKERTLAWRRNIYDDGGYYFIGEAEASPSCNIPAEAPAMTSSIVYTGHIHVDATDIDLTSPLSMGAVYCERSFTAADPTASHSPPATAWPPKSSAVRRAPRR